MTTDEIIRLVHSNFSRIYLGGIPSVVSRLMWKSAERVFRLRV